MANSEINISQKSSGLTIEIKVNACNETATGIPSNRKFQVGDKVLARETDPNSEFWQCELVVAGWMWTDEATAKELWGFEHDIQPGFNYLCHPAEKLMNGFQCRKPMILSECNLTTWTEEDAAEGVRRVMEIMFGEAA